MTAGKQNARRREAGSVCAAQGRYGRHPSSAQEIWEVCDFRKQRRNVIYPAAANRRGQIIIEWRENIWILY